MWVTGRVPTDAAGTMETPVIVPAGTGLANYNDFTTGGRAGDLSGINVDPVDGTFWAANEFANTAGHGQLGHRHRQFHVSSPLPSADLAVTDQRAVLRHGGHQRHLHHHAHQQRPRLPPRASS